MLLQRIFAAVLLLVCIGLALMAWPYQAAFSYEPVGPRAFPLLLLGLMGLALTYMLIRPQPTKHTDDEPPLDRPTLIKIGICVSLLLVFAGTFESLGFILSSMLIGIPMARLYGGRWLPGVVIITLMSVGLYLLFDKAMDVPLPLGLLDVTLRQWWGTPLVGLAGGYLASLVGWPLPYMVGSLLAIILVRCLTPWQLGEIPGGRKCGQWVVGIGIGLHFTPVVIEQVMSHFGLIFFGALVTSLSSIVGVWLMRRSGEDRATAFFSSMPGGSGEMVNLGARNGAVLSRVAAGQSLRVLLVVLCVPAIFKYLLGGGAPQFHPAPVDWAWLALLFPIGALVAWGWQRLRQPNPWLFGPLLVSAVASITWDLHIGLPEGGSQIGQWLIGSGLGCHFNRQFFRRAPSFMGRTVVGTLLSMLIATFAAVGLSALTQLDLRSLTLGMMPGGIAEMSLTAETLQLSVPLVTAMQVMRLLFVLFLAEPLFRHWNRQPDTV
eukprot:gene6022-5891_t